MLDLKFIRDNIDEVRRNCANRNVKVDLDRFLALETQRREAIGALEELRRRQNETAAAMKGKLETAQREQLIAQGRELKQQAQEAEEQGHLAEAELLALARQIPNMTHPDAPIAATEEGNREIRRFGAPTSFNFKPLDHVQLGTSG